MWWDAPDDAKLYPLCARPTPKGQGKEEAAAPSANAPSAEGGANTTVVIVVAIAVVVVVAILALCFVRSRKGDGALVEQSKSDKSMDDGAGNVPPLGETTP